MTDEQRAELAGCTSFSELHQRLSSKFDAPAEAAQASVARA
jgi:membrane glycosyltransferase